MIQTTTHAPGARRRHRRALAAAAAAVALAGTATWVSPADAAPGELALVVTVSTDAATCGTSSAIEVTPGSTVFYCYTMTNEDLEATVLLNNLTDTQLGDLLVQEEFQLDGGEQRELISTGVVAEETIESSATWSASGVEGFPFTPVTADATVTVVPAPTTTTTSTSTTTSTTPALPTTTIVTPVPIAAPASVVHAAPVYTG